MVEKRVTDGRRIAELLASELDSREDGALAPLAVVNADDDVTPSADGARAYDVERDGVAFATVFVHEDRARVEFAAGQAVAAETAADLDLRVRPKAVEPPRTLVFVESGAAVKRAADVAEAASAAAGDAA